MSAHQADQTTPIADELRQANERMTPNERVLGDALFDLVWEIHVAVETLSVLVDHDAELAPRLRPIADQLFAGLRSAVSVHAAVVVNVNQPTCH